MKFEGIYTPVITPFDDSGAIQWSDFSDVLERQIQAGVHGVIIGGSTGEFYTLSNEERLQQFKHSAEIINGRIPWIAGINHLLVDDCYQLAAQAKAAGASALLVAAPPYSLPTAQELAAHCQRIDEAAGLPILLYNYPGRTGVEMDDDFLEACNDIANVCAIKESSGDVNRIHHLIQNYTRLQVSAGAEDQVLEFFVWGARSWVSACANVFPEACVAYYECCVLNRDFDKGAKFAKALAPLMDLFEQSGQFVQCVKGACQTQGISTGPVRGPMLALDSESQARLKLVVEKTSSELQSIMQS